jgi:hypothetical protein
MEDQNDLARSAARAFKANVVTGGKGDKAELAAQPLLCTGRRNTWKSFSSDNSESLPDRPGCLEPGNLPKQSFLDQSWR